MDEQLKALDQVTTTAVDLGMKFAPKLVAAIVILVAGWFAARWAGRATLRALRSYQLEPPVRSLVERIARLFVLALFAIVALQNVGVELLPLIAGLGVAGAGIALAMQGVLGNIAAGLTIIFSKPFRVGDYISIVKEEGEVLEISLSSTTLGHADLSKVVIPNRKIVGEILHNYGRIRQLALEVAVTYDSDLQMALSVVNDVLARNARVLKDPAPVVGVTKLADAGALIGVGPWVAAGDFGAASAEVNQAILAAFQARGVRIPTRELRVVSSSAVLSAERRSAA
jgi:small conductance mechanosensitive channel